MNKPKSYYNENDPFVAAWLRELIKERLIADGEVDERSIADVLSGDLDGFAQCHFFAGIGGWSLALRLAGWPDDCSVWTGSCPCQAWSVAGHGKGIHDSSHLWPTWFRLIKERNPTTIFGEQVASDDGLFWLDLVYANLETQGYAVGASDLPAMGIGAFHRRARLFFVANANSDRRKRFISSARTAWLSEEFTRLVQTTIQLSLPASKYSALVDGIPNRMGQLRGFGNAIVPQVAQVFIEAFMSI